jgi:hypothetical protein
LQPTYHIDSIIIQCIIAYVNYSLDCWNAIFSPESLDEIDNTNSAVWDKYQSSSPDISPVDQRHRRIIADAVWNSLTDSENTPALDVLSPDVFAAVNQLTHNIVQSPDYFAATSTPTWNNLITEYTNDLLPAIEDYIKPSKSVKSTTKIKIAVALPRKLDWISYNHGNLHYAPVLPLVTPKVLDCVAQAFQHIPNALTEVRPVTPFSSHNHTYHLI